MAGTSTKSGGGPHRPRSGKSTAKRPRPRPSQSPALAAAGVAESGPLTPGTGQRSRRRPYLGVGALVALPREVEMAYIRSDLRRLLVIAAGLLGLMLVLLVLLDR